MELSDLWSTKGRLPDFQKIKLILSQHPEWVNEKHPRKGACLFEIVFSLVAPDDRDDALIEQILANRELKPTKRFIASIIGNMKSNFLARVIENPSLRSFVHYVESGELSYLYIVKKLEALIKDIEEAKEEDSADPAIEEMEVDIKNYNEMLAMLKEAVISQDDVSVFAKLQKFGVDIATSFIDPLKNPNIFSFLDGLAAEPSSPPESVRLRSSGDGDTTSPSSLSSTSSAASPATDRHSELLQKYALWRYNEERYLQAEERRVQAERDAWGKACRKMREEADSISQDLKRK